MLNGVFSLHRSDGAPLIPVFQAQKSCFPDRENSLETGAEYEARTRYLHLGKVALYQMS